MRKRKYLRNKTRSSRNNTSQHKWNGTTTICNGVRTRVPLDVNFFRINQSLLPYFNSRLSSGEMFKIFLGTGSNKNDISPSIVSNPSKEKNISFNKSKSKSISTQTSND